MPHNNHLTKNQRMQSAHKMFLTVKMRCSPDWPQGSNLPQATSRSHTHKKPKSGSLIAINQTGVVPYHVTCYIDGFRWTAQGTWRTIFRNLYIWHADFKMISSTMTWKQQDEITMEFLERNLLQNLHIIKVRGFTFILNYQKVWKEYIILFLALTPAI